MARMLKLMPMETVYNLKDGTHLVLALDKDDGRLVGADGSSEIVSGDHIAALKEQTKDTFTNHGSDEVVVEL